MIGGTGVAGHHTVDTLRRAGHGTIVIARSRGVDVTTGRGLDDALVGAPPKLFEAAMRNLLAAEQRARVLRHLHLPRRQDRRQKLLLQKPNRLKDFR